MAAQVRVRDTNEQQLRQACVELDRRLRAGDPCAAENLLAEYPDVFGDADNAIELIYTEFVTREELGRAPTPAEFYERFPQWRQELAAVLEVHAAVVGEPRPSNASWPASQETSRGPQATPFPERDEHGPPPRESGRIGQYELLEEIGQGGMGVVYKARQLGLDRIVALKMIIAGPASRRDRARFRIEAEAAARLQHPNIVQIHEVGEQDGRPYLSMEFVAGGNLEDKLAAGPLPARAAAAMIETLARAVHYAHERGVVHRDLKPANVLLECRGSRDESLGPENRCEASSSGTRPSTLDPRPRITDFGLAKQISFDDEGGAEQNRLTQAGAVLGTPGYMAPEQAGGRSRDVGPAADVYALGAILYETVTGRAPFCGESPLEILEQVRKQEPLPPRRLIARLPLDLDTICLKCLEKNPAGRYASAADLADDLGRFLAGEPIRARPIRFWGRALKWARRRPAAAALVVTIAAVVAVGFPTTTALWVGAEHSRAAAVEERNKADDAREAEHAERERVETLLYFHQVNLAHHEYLSHNLTRATQLLEGCRPDLRNWEWHYLDKLCHSALATLPHKLPVRGIAWSPDGKLIATCSGHFGIDQQGEVKIWDANSRKELFRLTGHPSSVRGVAFSPDGSRLASIGMVPGKSVHGGAIIWDVQTGDKVVSIPRGDGHSVAFSRDGKLIATGRRDGQLWLCDAATGKLIHNLAGHSGDVFCVAFGPDGMTAASCGNDRTARIWDLTSGKLVYTADLRGDGRSLAYSPDGRFLTVGTFGGVVRVWDIAKNQEVAAHETRAGGTRIAYSPDGRQLAVATGEAGVRIWDAATGAERRSFHGHLGAPISVAFSPDGRRLASGGSWDRTAMVWDLTADSVPLQFTGHVSHIADLAISPDGQRVALAASVRTSRPGRDTPKTTRVWDLARRRMIRELSGHSDWPTSVAYSPDGRRLITGSQDRTAKIWDEEKGRVLFTLEGHSDGVTSASFSPDGSTVVLASADRTVTIWDANTGTKTRTLAGHNDRVSSVVYSPDGQYLASAGADGTARIWDAATGKELHVLRGHSQPVTAVAFSRDGLHLASAGQDMLIHIWNVADVHSDAREPRSAPLVLRGHTDTILGLSFSPDGKRLASTALDASAKLWDVATGQETITLRTSANSRLPVSFSPDGKRLVVGHGVDVSVWNSVRDDDAVQADADGAAAQQHAIAWHESELRSCTRSNNWFAAAFHLGQLIAARPDHRPYFTQRGRAHVELEQWGKAAADYERAGQLDSGNDAHWQRSAYLYLRAGDHAGYRGLCPRFVAAFGATEDCRVANALAWTCVLAPDAGVEPAEIIRLAERGVAGARTELPAEVSTYLNTLGAVLFRAGRNDDAIERLHDAIDAHGDGGTPFDWLFLAMAHQRLGQPAEAREWFNQAVQWIDQQTVQKATGGEVDPLFTPGRQTMLQILRTEAESMLG